MHLTKRLNSIENAVRCGSFYQGVVAERVLDREISPISWEIIRKCAPEQKLWACLLVLTLNRYEELNTTNWTSWSGGKTQDIWQPKTATYKELPGLRSPCPPHTFNPDPTPHEVLLRYKSVAKAIRRSLPSEVLTLLRTQRIDTHVFRHIETSWHVYLKQDLDKIRFKLGHSSKEAIVAYQHTNLFI